MRQSVWPKILGGVIVSVENVSGTVLHIIFA